MKFLFICAILISQFSQAQFVIRAENTSVSSYQNYLKEHGKKSYVEHFLGETLQKDLADDLIDPCLEALVDVNEKTTITCLKIFREIQQKPWNQKDITLVSLFLDRIESLDFPKEDQKKLQGLRQSLKSQEITLPHSLSAKEALYFLKSKSQKTWFADTAILVNGLELNDNRISKYQSGIHQWLVLGNTHKEIIFVGEWSELLKFISNKNHFIFWFSGSKEDFKAPLAMTQGEIFLDSNTVEPLALQSSLAEELETKKSFQFLKEPANWVLPAVAVALVVSALALKDKEVSIGF